MAVSFSSTVVKGTARLPGSTSKSVLVEPRTSNVMQPRLRAVSEASSRNEGNITKHGVQIPNFIDKAIEKPRALWWASLFEVSVEDQWTTLLATSKSNVKETERPETSSSLANSSKSIVKETEEAETSPRLAPGNTTTTSLSEVIDSTTQERRQHFSKVIFTPEKARALRKSMRDSDTWHDEWYHSPIATRLAEAID